MTRKEARRRKESWESGSIWLLYSVITFKACKHMTPLVTTCHIVRRIHLDYYSWGHTPWWILSSFEYSLWVSCKGTPGHKGVGEEELWDKYSEVLPWLLTLNNKLLYVAVLGAMDSRRGRVTKKQIWKALIGDAVLLRNLKEKSSLVWSKQPRRVSMEGSVFLVPGQGSTECGYRSAETWSTLMVIAWQRMSSRGGLDGLQISWQGLPVCNQMLNENLQVFGWLRSKAELTILWEALLFLALRKMT